MKWVLFGLSFFALCVANAVLFWVPDISFGFGTAAAIVAISIAGALAFFASKRFAEKPPSSFWKSVVLAPPAVIWLFVLLILLYELAIKYSIYHRL